MNDTYHKAMLFMHNGDHLPERLWAYDDYTDLEDRPADSVTGLTSLGFIRAALRRSAWLWRILAVAGMLAGFGIAAKLHTVYQASTSVLLTPMSVGSEGAGAPITNEQAIAESHTVAELVMSELGLRQSVNSFLASYTVTVVTDRVLEITVNAPSSSDAVSRATALTTEFLSFRVNLLEAQQKLLLSSLDQQVSQDRQNVNSITARISQVSAEAQSPRQRAELSALLKQQSQATNTLTTFEQAATQEEASTQVNIDTIVQSSRVLDAASPIPPHSRLKRILEYTALGLMIGLALGLGLVVVRALLSDRLRRRDDVAHALGAPVKLSVGTVRRSWRKLAGARSTNAKRIAAYLGTAVPPRRHGPATLAVVPVDDVRVPAICLVSLALSRAQQGLKVVVADLCDGAPVAGLLGVTDPGVQTVNVRDTRLVVAVPERDEFVPVGPLRSRPGQARTAPPLAAACGSADLLLTLATLDPSLGGEHLAGWAHGAVVVVTAGRTSAARIRAVGEMIRLAGMPLLSAVLVGADKSDESLGLAPTPEADRDAVVAEGLHSDAKGFFVTVDEGPRGRPSADR